MGNPPHFPYGITVLSATRHKWTRLAITPANQAGTRFTYPGRMEFWVDLGSVIAARVTDRESNPLPLDRKSDALTVTPPNLVQDSYTSFLTVCRQHRTANFGGRLTISMCIFSVYNSVQSVMSLIQDRCGPPMCLVYFEVGLFLCLCLSPNCLLIFSSTGRENVASSLLPMFQVTVCRPRLTAQCHLTSYDDAGENLDNFATINLKLHSASSEWKITLFRTGIQTGV